MGKKKSIVAEEAEKGAVSKVRFTAPAFRYKGVEYNSALVEKAVNEGDEEATAMVANLVKINSGVVEVTEEGGSHE